VKDGFVRSAHLRSAALAGGDAAARSPMQAASGFLGQLDGIPDLTASPFHFGLIGSSLRERFRHDGIFVVSLVSSPGAGKTAFLEKTLTILHQNHRVWLR
jgi:hypothetical protein